MDLSEQPLKGFLIKLTCVLPVVRFMEQRPGRVLLEVVDNLLHRRVIPCFGDLRLQVVQVFVKPSRTEHGVMCEPAKDPS